MVELIALSPEQHRELRRPMPPAIGRLGERSHF